MSLQEVIEGFGLESFAELATVDFFLISARRVPRKALANPETS
jgi:hypothetical protein